MLKSLWIPCLLALLTAACGSSASSSGDLAVNGNSSAVGTGTDTGDTSGPNTLFVIPAIDHNSVIAPTDTGPQVANFIAADAATFQYPAYQGVAGINAEIVINSTANACGDANANTFHVGETQLVITITDIPDPQIVANTYIFPAPASAPYEIASATYAVVQAPCYYNSVSLVSGQVTITHVQPASLSGSYNLTFSSGTVSGTFNTTPTCAAVGRTPASGPICN